MRCPHCGELIEVPEDDDDLEDALFDADELGDDPEDDDAAA